MRRALANLVRPIPLAVSGVVLVAVVVLGVLVLRGSSPAPTTKAKFAVAIDGSCFATEQAMPAGDVPSGGAALQSYLDKALPNLRNADNGQHQIGVPPDERALAERFLARFHAYVEAVSRTRDALRANDPAAQAAAAVAAHQAYTDLVDMAEPLDSSSCPPQPELP
ncbi:MAG: hypothetical protein JOZ99_10620 [Actinobacteria bacterium]|nr:hypothetical protein [Actinomycetota bacterium]